MTDRPASDITVEAVRAILAPRAPLYKIRTPNYQTVLLQQLRTIWDAAHRRVLDVGGGTGLLAESIYQLFPVDSVTSVDVENRFLPNLNVTTAVFDGQTLPFPDNSFDCAVLNNVLHHVPRQHRVKLVSECKRVAGPVYVKDHLSTGAIDRIALHFFDVIGNVPFSGMVKAEYLDSAEWRELATLTGYEMSTFRSGKYRGGIEALLGPNRLDFISRFEPISDAEHRPNAP